MTAPRNKSYLQGKRKEKSMILKAFITPLGAFILLAVIGIVIAACVVARKQRNNLMDEGKLIQREP